MVSLQTNQTNVLQNPGPRLNTLEGYGLEIVRCFKMHQVYFNGDCSVSGFHIICFAKANVTSASTRTLRLQPCPCRALPCSKRYCALRSAATTHCGDRGASCSQIRQASKKLRWRMSQCESLCDSVCPHVVPGLEQRRLLAAGTSRARTSSGSISQTRSIPARGVLFQFKGRSMAMPLVPLCASAIIHAADTPVHSFATASAQHSWRGVTV
jgi:hypothetical protein